MQVYHPLIAGAAKQQTYIPLIYKKRAVNQHIATLQQPGDDRVGSYGLIAISRIAPYAVTSLAQLHGKREYCGSLKKRISA